MQVRRVPKSENDCFKKCKGGPKAHTQKNDPAALSRKRRNLPSEPETALAAAVVAAAAAAFGTWDV